MVFPAYAGMYPFFEMTHKMTPNNHSSIRLVGTVAEAQHLGGRGLRRLMALL